MITGRMLEAHSGSGTKTEIVYMKEDALTFFNCPLRSRNLKENIEYNKFKSLKKQKCWYASFENKIIMIHFSTIRLQKNRMIFIQIFK